MKRQDKFKRRALIGRRNRVNPEQATLRERNGTTLASENAREATKAKIAASMKEMWARKRREAGAPNEDTEAEGMEHAGSPDTELEHLDRLLGVED